MPSSVTDDVKSFIELNFEKLTCPTRAHSLRIADQSVVSFGYNKLVIDSELDCEYPPPPLPCFIIGISGDPGGQQPCFTKAYIFILCRRWLGCLKCFVKAEAQPRGNRLDQPQLGDGETLTNSASTQTYGPTNSKFWLNSRSNLVGQCQII